MAVQSQRALRNEHRKQQRLTARLARLAKYIMVLSDGDTDVVRDFVTAKCGDTPDVLDGAVDWYLQATDKEVLELEERLATCQDSESKQARCFVQGARTAAWVAKKNETMAVAPNYAAVAKKLHDALPCARRDCSSTELTKAAGKRKVLRFKARWKAKYGMVRSQKCGSEAEALAKAGLLFLGRMLWFFP